VPHTTPSTAEHPTIPDAHVLRLRISPVSEEDVAAWAGLLTRQPAIVWALLTSIEPDVARFTLGITSLSRLHVQLDHLASCLGARFEPTEDGELSITLCAD
jgi:hypothetical protein